MCLRACEGGRWVCQWTTDCTVRDSTAGSHSCHSIRSESTDGSQARSQLSSVPPTADSTHLPRMHMYRRGTHAISHSGLVPPRKSGPGRGPYRQVPSTHQYLVSHVLCECNEQRVNNSRKVEVGSTHTTDQHFMQPPVAG